MAKTKAEKLSLEYIKVKDLKPYPHNPRVMQRAGIDKLMQSIESFGFVSPVIAQRSTGYVLAGNQRLKAARKADLKTVPVIWIDLSDDEAAAYNIADNRLGEESWWDLASLTELLEDLARSDHVDLMMTGLNQKELDQHIEVAADTSFLDDMTNAPDPEPTTHRDAAQSPAPSGSSMNGVPSTEPSESSPRDSVPQNVAYAEPNENTADPEPVSASGRLDAYVTFQVAMTVQQHDELLDVLNDERGGEETVGNTLWRLVTGGH